METDAEEDKPKEYNTNITEPDMLGHVTSGQHGISRKRKQQDYTHFRTNFNSDLRSKFNQVLVANGIHSPQQ